MLKVTNLTFQYKNTHNAYQFSMSLEAQEIVAILGASGSGKSTFLDLIAGFLTPISGELTLDKKDLITQMITHRPISILFQNHNLFEHLSVYKNILLGLGKTGSSKMNKKKTEDILIKVGLRKYQNTLVSSLSGGEQQRVALARVLLREKPILLLDEPFNSLDEKTKNKMLFLVKKVSLENNIHTIMVTHEIKDAKLISNKIYKINNYKFIKYFL